MSNALATLSPADLAKYLENPIHAESALLPSGDAEDNRKDLPAYVGFRGKKTEKNVDSLEAAGIQENQFYLRSDGEFLPLVPCDLHIVKACKLYTIQDQKQKITDVIMGRDVTTEEFQDGFRPQIFAAVGVVLGDTIVPATLMLRSAQTRALETALKLLNPQSKPPGAATDPAVWGSRSPKHKAAAAVKWAGGRFRVRISNTLEDGNNGDYNLGHGTIIPTPESAVATLNNWYTTDGARIALVLAMTEARIQKARSIANGEKQDDEE